MERSVEPCPPAVVEEQSSFEFSKEESQLFQELSAVLSAKQMRAVYYESAGLDARVVAANVKVSPQTITLWRKDPDYANAVDLLVSIYNRVGINFRINVQKRVIAPIYAELMRRTSNPKIIKRLEIKEVLDVLKIVSKELRMDSMNAGSEENDDFREIQERRNSFSYAKQAADVENLMKEEKIIQFPTGTNGH